MNQVNRDGESILSRGTDICKKKKRRRSRWQPAGAEVRMEAGQGRLDKSSQAIVKGILTLP